MQLMLITDAWQPQVNGVVTTLVELQRELQKIGHEVQVIHPGLFRTRPCPGYAGIDLAVHPAKALSQMLEHARFDAIHIATEGPLGWAARSYCLRHRLRFTTAFHTRFPEILNKAARMPLAWGYAMFRHFHRPSSGVMVPTQSMMRLLDRYGFRHLRAWTHGIDAQSFAFSLHPRLHPLLIGCKRPIALFVGRISYEKNIEEFLRMPHEGSKVVCGTGPLEVDLKKRFADVHWLGVLDRSTLAHVYASADVFVMPSRHETFGLVMLEAMACGTPVAAFPVEGPTEVLGQPAQGGVLHENLQQATQAALKLPRYAARERALCFSWQTTALSFISHLVAARPDVAPTWSRSISSTLPDASHMPTSLASSQVESAI